MSFLFGSKQAPQPVPLSPDNRAAEQARADADTAAIADAKARGRRSTMVGGLASAEEEQSASGLLSVKRRAASRDLVG